MNHITQEEFSKHAKYEGVICHACDTCINISANDDVSRLFLVLKLHWGCFRHMKQSIVNNRI